MIVLIIQNISNGVIIQMRMNAILLITCGLIMGNKSRSRKTPTIAPEVLRIISKSSKPPRQEKS